MGKAFCYTQVKGIILSSITIMLYSGTANSQSVSSDSSDKVFVVARRDEPYKTIYSEQPKAYTFVDQMPEFPGGDKALMEFLRKNINYPQTDSMIRGKVLIRFTVNEDGKVDDIVVLRGLRPDFDLEAVRVVSRLPKFIPGRQQGKPVRVFFNLPVVFN